MKTLPNDVKELGDLVRELMSRIAVLEEENAELRRQLGKNSSNSHKPPSSDWLEKKAKTKPALPKEKIGTKGGQLGHKGKTLEKCAEVDEVVLHMPKECSSCGREFGSEALEDVVVLATSRQVFDLPPVKLEVSEHRLGEVECCGQYHKGTFPAEVSASVQYGSGVRAVVSMLSTDYRMPLKKIRQFFTDMYGYEINSATILASLERGYKLLEPTVASIKGHLTKAYCAHFDETGLRCEKKLHWLHTVSNAD